MQPGNKGRFKMLYSFIKGLRWFYVLAVFFTMLAIVFNYLMPQIIRIIVDNVIGANELKLPKILLDFVNQIGGIELLRSSLVICAFLALLLAVLSGVFTYLYRYCMARASEGTIRKMRNRLYEHIQKFPYSWHVKNQTGDIVQRCTSDVETVKNFLSIQFNEMVRTVFLVGFSLTLMFLMNVKLSLVALAFLPVVIAYSGIFFKKIADRFKYADEAEGALSAMVQENFTGVRVVRAFGRQAYEIDNFDNKNDYFANYWIKLGYLLSKYWGIGDLVSGLQVMLIIVLGAVEASHGVITLGEFLVFVYYNSMLVWPVRQFGRILSEMSKTSVSLNRINEILSQEQEKDCPDAVTPPMNRDIEFKNVTFDYEGQKTVLKDISFKIKAGTTFGILGGTGSGKSTVMYLLDRLFELPRGNGSIEIGGVDIRKIRLEHLRKNIGFVLQEPFLFSKTIQQNIDAFDGSSSIESIRHFAEIAAVDDAVMGFSKGYETIVGERGVTLSGGQKQRVAIARMLMQSSPIMIFDDSLSAVDSETDSKIRGALKQNTSGSTVVLVSHRITTLMNADVIMVLEDGRISEMGTHSQLLQNENGVYKKIYDIQSSLETELQGPEQDALTGGDR
ncbi:putative multidrug resistance ABC transporter ATP-binding/permease protein YheI [Ruminiclostridium hungatei]|uniref:Putative multidrug resistance ABC transporter ATP-binding/permease protein YheI n=1 Tax=Ruminiclostridium hungatei TaxID=48256 RepID=A0A1V4SFV5_RUMHU|nr:ABC transporter ATP-binding protein [Ruminiclostridium hungatei]OPX42623.1 putative multidrug resistance ABC transporter ATP-binding/permease protein YheI [Ruminiclostridium hungatei]